MYFSSKQTAVCCHPVFFKPTHGAHHEKCQDGWVTSWNQGRQEKYQQPQICGWYHFKGRKRKGTKEPLDEGEGGEWKSLKTKY